MHIIVIYTILAGNCTDRDWCIEELVVVLLTVIDKIYRCFLRIWILT